MNKSTVFEDLRYCAVMGAAISQFRKDFVEAVKLHTGLRQGRRSDAKYIKYVISKGFTEDELQDLGQRILSVTFEHPSADTITHSSKKS